MPEGHTLYMIKAEDRETQNRAKHIIGAGLMSRDLHGKWARKDMGYLLEVNGSSSTIDRLVGLNRCEVRKIKFIDPAVAEQADSISRELSKKNAEIEALTSELKLVKHIFRKFIKRVEPTTEELELARKIRDGVD